MSLTMSFTGPVQGLTAPIVIADPVAASGGSIDSIPTLSTVNGVPISSPLQINTTVGALCLNQLTTTQINAIVTPFNGMLTYNSTTNLLNAYLNGAWTAIEAGGGTGVFSSIQNGAGIVSLPSYTFTGDLTTGIWHSAADTIDFSTGGSEQFQISNTNSSVNFLSATGSATGLGLGAGPALVAVGTDTNIDVVAVPKGTGGLAVRGATNAGSIVLWNQANTFATAIESSNVASNLTWLWPITDATPPAGATTTSVAMSSNAAGTLSFSLTGSNYATGTLTAANINSMFTTGIQLLAAPGAGFAIIVDYFVLELVGATQFAAGGVVYLNYSTTGHGTTLASQIMPVGAITAANGNNTICSASGLISNTVTPSPEGVQLVSTSVTNQAIAITNATQLFTTGTGTARWYIWYSVVPVA